VIERGRSAPGGGLGTGGLGGGTFSGWVVEDELPDRGALAGTPAASRGCIW